MAVSQAPRWLSRYQGDVSEIIASERRVRLSVPLDGQRGGNYTSGVAAQRQRQPEATLSVGSGIRSSTIDSLLAASREGGEGLRKGTVVDGLAISFDVSVTEIAECLGCAQCYVTRAYNRSRFPPLSRYPATANVTGAPALSQSRSLPFPHSFLLHSGRSIRSLPLPLFTPCVTLRGLLCGKVVKGVAPMHPPICPLTCGYNGAASL
jgi:hypothetical protein